MSEWIKFRDQMPPEPISSISAGVPVMIGINTKIDGLLVDFVYWVKSGKNKWKLNYQASYIYDVFNFNLVDLSWHPYSLPAIEEEP